MMKSKAISQSMHGSLFNQIWTTIVLLAVSLSMLVAAHAAKTAQPETIASLLSKGNYSRLDDMLNQLQNAFESGEPDADKKLLATFEAFHMPNAEQHLTAWVTSSPRSYAAHLTRGNFYIRKGLDARGERYASATKASEFANMRHWFGLGQADLKKSLGLTKKPFLSHRYLLIAAMRSESHEVVAEHFYAAIAFAPMNMELRLLYMESLEPRWGGSYEAMDAFIEESEKTLGPGPKIEQMKSYIPWIKGWLLMANDDVPSLQKALTFHSDAISLYDKPRYRCSRARILVKLRRVPEAMEDMQAAYLSPLRAPESSDYCRETVRRIAVKNTTAPGLLELINGYLQEQPNDKFLLAQRGWLFQQRDDRVRAYADYQAAAAMENEWAMLMQARYVFNGWGGVTADREKGLALFKIVARKGNLEAQECAVDALNRMDRTFEATLTDWKYTWANWKKKTGAYFESLFE